MRCLNLPLTNSPSTCATSGGDGHRDRWCARGLTSWASRLPRTRAAERPTGDVRGYVGTPAQYWQPPPREPSIPPFNSQLHSPIIPSGLCLCRCQSCCLPSRWDSRSAARRCLPSRPSIMLVRHQPLTQLVPYWFIHTGQLPFLPHGLTTRAVLKVSRQLCGEVRPASCLNEYRPSSRMNVNASGEMRPGKGPKDVQGGEVARAPKRAWMTTDSMLCTLATRASVRHHGRHQTEVRRGSSLGAARTLTHVRIAVWSRSLEFAVGSRGMVSNSCEAFGR